ncbi:hypothetical protein PoB_004974400 [Plakobranchus ocellatus]|uniref:Uncharacterized protein n=1 Tax=Plakobranchus ocellatus TaxID=259542 RepID=A0AAV4BST5_9GAST|nr:hypothetical protein PoB_004974400 [Plakobranchus ocellatus]
MHAGRPGRPGIRRDRAAVIGVILPAVARTRELDGRRHFKHTARGQIERRWTSLSTLHAPHSTRVTSVRHGQPNQAKFLLQRVRRFWRKERQWSLSNAFVLPTN